VRTEGSEVDQEVEQREYGWMGAKAKAKAKAKTNAYDFIEGIFREMSLT